MLSYYGSLIKIIQILVLRNGVLLKKRPKNVEAALEQANG